MNENTTEKHDKTDDKAVALLLALITASTDKHE